MTTSISPIASTAGARRVDDLGPGAHLVVEGALIVDGVLDRADVDAGGDLTVHGRAGGSTLVAGGDVAVAGAHCCGIRAAGALRLSGAGASDCDIEVRGDLIAMGHDSVVHSGLLHVGARLRARELSGRVGARLRVVMTSREPVPDLLVADRVHYGVEVVVCGELLRFDRRHADVRIGVIDGRAVVQTA